MFPPLKRTRMLTPEAGERYTDSILRVLLFSLAVFGVYALGQVLIGVVVGLICPNGVGLTVGRLLSLLSTLFTVAGSLVCCLCIERRTLATMGFIRRGAVVDYLIGVVLGVLMIAASLGLCMALGGATVTIASAQPSVLTLGAFLVGFLIQGMSEEMLCRSQLMVSLSRRWPLWLCAVGNALLFSLFHLGNPGVTVIALLNIFLFGLFASVLVLRRGSIWMAGAIHSLWNFAQGNLFGIPVSGLTGAPAPLRTAMPAETTLERLVGGGAFGLEGGLAVTAVLMVSLLVVMLMPTKKSECVDIPLPENISSETKSV